DNTLCKERPGSSKINTEFSKEIQPRAVLYHRTAGDVLGALMGKKHEQEHHEDKFHFFMAWVLCLLLIMFFLSMIGA
ncbi:MAG TPA: hypothetical protein VGT81_03285, partial [Casimicrobiaceae bacterium]|nr:hypothetical protein [Casimicrobiaceae bacterium]